MTEQPDTAGYRALHDRWDADQLRAAVLILADTLDAVRADCYMWMDHCENAQAKREAAEAMRDTHAADVTDLANKHAQALDRAEDWKERHHRERERAQAAEARVAAALAVLRDAYDRGDFEAIELALTGDTT